MNATHMVCCPGCGVSHPVSSAALIDADPDSLDLLCDGCAAEYDEAFIDDEPWDGFRDDVEADADALASAGWGTDEDYGYYGDGEDW